MQQPLTSRCALLATTWDLYVSPWPERHFLQALASRRGLPHTWSQSHLLRVSRPCQPSLPTGTQQGFFVSLPTDCMSPETQQGCELPAVAVMGKHCLRTQDLRCHGCGPLTCTVLSGDAGLVRAAVAARANVNARIKAPLKDLGLVSGLSPLALAAIMTGQELSSCSDFSRPFSEQLRSVSVV